MDDNEVVIKKTKIQNQDGFVFQKKGSTEQIQLRADQIPQELLSQFQSSTYPKSLEILQRTQANLAQQQQIKFSCSKDEIEQLQLLVINNELVFKVFWKQRFDGQIPHIDYYVYQQFKTLVPIIFMKYLEFTLFGTKCDQINFIPLTPYSQESINIMKQLLQTQIDIYEQMGDIVLELETDKDKVISSTEQQEPQRQNQEDFI
ncbi:hypothetical protein pb186bvf_020109 [Paramecium bursaria]